MSDSATDLPPTHCMTETGVAWRPEALASMRALRIPEAALELFVGSGLAMLSRAPATDEAPDNGPPSPSHSKGNGHAEPASNGNGHARSAGNGSAVCAADDDELEEALSPSAAKLVRLRVKGLYCDQARTTLFKLRKTSGGRLVPQRVDPPGMPVLHQVSRPEGPGSRNPADEIRYLLGWSSLPWQPPVWVTGKDLSSGDNWSLFPGVAISGRTAAWLYSDIVKAQVAAFDVPVALAPRVTGLSRTAAGTWRFVLNDGRELLATGVSPDPHTAVYDYELAGAQAAAWESFVPPREVAAPSDVSWLARELNDIDPRGRLWLLLCFGVRGFVASVAALGAAAFLVGTSGSGKTSSVNLVRNLTGPCPPDAPPHANFQATETSVELVVASLQDVLGLIDDFHPNDFDREADIKRGYRIIDAIVTSSADGGEMRGRATRDVHKRAGTVIRCCPFMTAETYDGALRSRMRRLIYLAYEKDDVNTEQLYDPETWRSCAALVTKLGHAVIRWVLKQLDRDLSAFRSWVRERDRINTDYLFNLLMQARPAADRQIVQSVAMRYARTMTGADMVDAATDANERQAAHALSIYVLPLALAQIDLDGAGGPASITREWVTDAIRTILTTGRGHLLSHKGKSLALVDPALPGELLSDSGYARSSGAYEPRGGCIGFLSDDLALRYFRPDELRVLLMAQAKAEKLVWRWTAQTFPAAMMGLGLVEQHDDGRCTKLSRIGREDDTRKTYLVVSVSSLEGEKNSADSADSADKGNYEHDFNNLVPIALSALPKPTALTALTKQPAQASALVAQAPESGPGVSAVSAVGFGSADRTAALKTAENLGFQGGVSAVSAVSAVSGRPIEPATAGPIATLPPQKGPPPTKTVPAPVISNPKGLAADPIAVLPPQTVKPFDPLAPPRRVSPAEARRAEKARAQVRASMDRSAALPATSAAPGPAVGANGIGPVTAAGSAERAGRASAIVPSVKPNGAGTALARPAEQPDRGPSTALSARPNGTGPAAAPLEQSTYNVAETNKPDAWPERIMAVDAKTLCILTPDGSIERHPLPKELYPENICAGQLAAFMVSQQITQLWLHLDYAKLLVADALTDETGLPDGWVFGSHKKRKRPSWLRIKRDKQEVFIVLPHHDGIETDNAIETIGAVKRFHELTGFWYRLHPTVVFNAMLRVLHRHKHGLNMKGDTPPAELPDVMRTETVSELWMRALSAKELASKYIHSFDKNGQYLAAMSSLHVGFGRMEYRSEADPESDFNPTVAGYWNARVTTPQTWPDCLPFLHEVRKDADGYAWYVTPVLKYALANGARVEVREAWVFPDKHQPFTTLQKRLRDARLVLEEAPKGSADKAADQMIKSVYSRGIGNLDKHDRREMEEIIDLHRPDWRQFIIAEARMNLMRNLRKYDLQPFAIIKDEIYLVSDSDDPVVAANGLPLDPKRLGCWKHTGCIRLSEVPTKLLGKDASRNPQRTRDQLKAFIEGRCGA